MIPRHIETVYCDDIRQEVLGKVTYVGVYSGDLLVPKFPATLPKLCLWVRVVTPANEPLRSLTIYVHRDGDLLQEVSLSDEQLAAASDLVEGMPENERNEKYQTAQIMLAFSPIQFDGPCILRVRAQTETDELRGLALTVSQSTQSNDTISEIAAS